MIDAHTHVWDLADTPQPWIGPDAAPFIERNFSLAELRGVVSGTPVDHVILVQSANSCLETEGLLRQAQADRLVAGVVGWADLADARAEALIEGALDGPGGQLLRGWRHVFEPGQADGWLRDHQVRSSLNLLGRLGLSFDLLLRADELRLAAAAARRHQRTVFVLDHLAKPNVRQSEIDPWRRELVELGREQNVYAKFSGLPAEADWRSWSVADLRPYFDAALEAFGPERLIFATDWPVCTVAGTYSSIVDAQLQLCAELTPGERDRLLGANAAKAYQANPLGPGSGRER